MFISAATKYLSTKYKKASKKICFFVVAIMTEREHANKIHIFRAPIL